MSMILRGKRTAKTVSNNEQVTHIDRGGATGFPSLMNYLTYLKFSTTFRLVKVF